MNKNRVKNEMGGFMKKIIAVMTVILMIIAFSSCKDKNDVDVAETTSGKAVNENESTDESKHSGDTDVFFESSSEESAVSTNEMSAENDLTEANSASRTDEEIIAFYKAAAAKSKNVKSKQTMSLEEMVVNEGGGILGTLVDLATPIMVSALEKNSTEFDGITGGYENLTLSDVASVKSYKSGEYTVVEMTTKEQTDGIHGDVNSGTVGHAISVVGDISSVEKELPQFEIGFEEADIKLHYSNPTLKVKINKNGIIEKGTWSYTVNIDIKNLRVDAVKVPLGATVDTAYGVVGYVITVGGGF